ncbi:glycosyltransferase family 4 protein [Sphingomonas canadensis]|uniref:Glycosyltransferase family 4 protein n=1 Tax=Sphingomonas canadensis TaxID=1219257 RepID=A0ABW3H9M6_9SPHN|nr:glycosyltransferase family 1 protein [Sphingomonas canadensis]MCW3837579.1 glycosyltransferase family 1 protein [Sphingomonas canadensis]
MHASDLRVALFSGNYNYVRDGANQSLNRLMGYVMAQGAKVRVYSPTTSTPAFEPTGDLVSVPSLPFPGGRSEYRLALGLTPGARRDLEAYQPNLIHCSAPEFLCHGALKWAEKHGIARVATAQTRFETYFRYYGLGFVEPSIIRLLTRFYNRFDEVMPTGPMMVDLLRSYGVTVPMSIWSRGVDHAKFNPARRDMAWRRSIGIGDDEVVVGFLGRLVLEKGLDVFSDVMAILRERDVPHRVLVIGEGPARQWFADRVPEAVFVGFQVGEDLARGVASMDIFFNPSITESFGNVTLEAMASGVAVVAARTTGPVGLVEEGVSGILVEPGDNEGYAAAIAGYALDAGRRQAAGEAGHAIAQRFHWDRINQAALDTYLRAAEKRTQ